MSSISCHVFDHSICRGVSSSLWGHSCLASRSGIQPYVSGLRTSMLLWRNHTFNAVGWSGQEEQEGDCTGQADCVRTVDFGSEQKEKAGESLAEFVSWIEMRSRLVVHLWEFYCHHIPPQHDAAHTQFLGHFLNDDMYICPTNINSKLDT